MTNSVKFNDTTIPIAEKPRLGLHWMPTTNPDVWVAIACGRTYTIEPSVVVGDRDSVRPIAWVVYDPQWPGRALECATFPEAVIAAQLLADGFEGEPTQYDLERAAMTAVAALAHHLVQDQCFTFTVSGEGRGDSTLLHHVHLEIGTTKTSGSRSDTRLRLVPKND